MINIPGHGPSPELGFKPSYAGIIRAFLQWTASWLSLTGDGFERFCGGRDTFGVLVVSGGWFAAKVIRPNNWRRHEANWCTGPWVPGLDVPDVGLLVGFWSSMILQREMMQMVEVIFYTADGPAGGADGMAPDTCSPASIGVGGLVQITS